LGFVFAISERKPNKGGCSMATWHCFGLPNSGATRMGWLCFFFSDEGFLDGGGKSGDKTTEILLMEQILHQLMW